MKNAIAKILAGLVIVGALIITLGFVVFESALILAPIYLALETGKITFLFFEIVSVPVATFLWSMVESLFETDEE